MKNKFPPRDKRNSARKSDRAERIYLYGRHTVEAAMANPARLVHGLFATQNGISRLEEAGLMRDNLPVTIESPRDLSKRVPADAVHQGLIAHVEPLTTASEKDLADFNRLLILDQVTDPHNIGAILRSACAMGVDALITTTRHSPAETGVLAKAASGAADILPRIEVKNLAKCLDELGKHGFMRIALDSDATRTLGTGELHNVEKIALVLGSEGKGVRPGVRAQCDELLKLEMPGPIKSLNVSIAAAVTMAMVFLNNAKK